ncbi:MAG: alpha/beta fold hydrolase [Actinomycetota bacterium]
MTERHTVTAGDGTTIAYADHGGEGPPTLLVHGITERAEAWAPIVDRLVDDHRVYTMDLRGHGASGLALDYGLEAMAGDVVAVMETLGILGECRLVGHSLGGMVVTAVGAVAPVASIVNVDQSLKLGSFKAQLADFESMLRDPETFPAVIEGLFALLGGEKIDPAEMARVNALRGPKQDVVLGVWELVFSLPEDEINAVVEAALAGYAGNDTPYFTLFGVDPEPGYHEWLNGFVANATTEVWAGHGHYPHLVDPDHFVERLRAFWA